jgi:serine/threonine protein kinase
LPDLPDRIGPYHPLERIGAGGFGVVYLARARGMILAVKVLETRLNGTINNRELRLRMRREVEITQRITSPHVARVVAFDLDCQPPYVVTRYVEGASLADEVEENGPLDGDRLGHLARGLAEALQEIHAAGCVHRDLKPANVMLAEDDIPVVIDFGISHEIGATRITQAGAAGTNGYIAPELIMDEPPAPPADVFAWGATIVYACTGRRAFPGRTPDAVLNNVLSHDPDLGGVPEPLAGLLAQALAKSPADRPTAHDLVQRLAALNRGRTRTQPDREDHPAPSTAPAHRLGRIALSILAWLAVGGVAGLLGAYVVIWLF